MLEDEEEAQSLGRRRTAMSSPSAVDRSEPRSDMYSHEAVDGSDNSTDSIRDPGVIRPICEG